MTNTAIFHLVAACAGVFGLAAFVVLVLEPALRAYTRTWERLAATALSLYVLATLVGLGIAAGVAVSLWVWPRLF